MALELVGGAVLGVLFGELQKEICRVKENFKMFKPKLEELEETLTILFPVIEEIEELNRRLNRPNHGRETITLRRLLEDGTKLVSKCSKIPRWDFVKQGRYRGKLVELDNKILRFHSLYLQAHMGRDQKQTLLFVRETRQMMIMALNQQGFSNLTMGFTDSSDLTTSGSIREALNVLEGLIPGASVGERNLIAYTAKILEDNKVLTHTDDLRKIVTVGLSSLGYDSYICKFKTDNTLSYPAGEHEYIEVIVESKRLFIDIYFRSEFDIDQSTGAYRGVAASVPVIVVGESDRLCQSISTSEKPVQHPLLQEAVSMLIKVLSSTCTINASSPRDLGREIGRFTASDLLFSFCNPYSSNFDIESFSESILTELFLTVDVLFNMHNRYSLSI